MRSLARSMPSLFLNSETSHSMIRSSRSSPPRWVSPLVAFTSTTPSPTSRIEMSKVPPPKSYTAIVSSFFLSSPYARAAAVGSLTMRLTSRPAIRPASLVAWRCASLKYAGTVARPAVPFPPREPRAVEMRGGTDDRLGDLLTQVVLRRLAHLLQDHGRDLGRRQGLVLDLDHG